MAALILLRHGKSDREAGEGQADRARPLARRGRKAAKAVGRFLARADQVPDAAITSPAVRAAETLRLVMAAGEWACPTRSAERLYDGGVPGLFAEIRSEPPTTNLLLVVGHEPTWSEAVASLVGGARLRFPTGALARIDLDVDDWEQIGSAAGELAWSVTARLLAAR